MAVQPILRMGDPRLLQRSQLVRDFSSAALTKLIDDMYDTMRAAEGAGLAAIQIGVPLRVVIFGFEHNERYPDCPPVPESVLINPQIEVLSQHQNEAWEGCLSVPGMRGLVPRYTHIRYHGVDPDGQSIVVEARDFHARVVQHECDHLDGILYPMRIRDLAHYGFIEELQRFDVMRDASLPCESEPPA